MAECFHAEYLGGFEVVHGTDMVACVFAYKDNNARVN
jgi:hypothetical protein